MTVHLHWRDLAFPLGPEHPTDDQGRPVYDGETHQPIPGEHPCTRRAAFATVAEALEQAAHDLAFDGATIVHLINEKGKDVLDRKKLVTRANQLIDTHHEPIRDALKDSEFAARVAAAKADAERRVG